jgi:ABC-type nitrate/sulfonate/bicarbonate transport system ATPase subunit/ABC-type nitrate/sulfonate/bicarbonate transport system permease component
MTPRFGPLQARRVAMVLLALLAIAALWELYKLVIPEAGVSIGESLVLPRSDDASMPHLSAIFGAFGKAEVTGAAGSSTVASAVLSALWYSLRLALAGFVVGVVVGMLLALAMQRLRIVRRAVLPYVVLSQTVPLIALAPLVYGWGGNLTLFGAEWQPWMSVSVIAAYLAFFPVAVGALRGLSSPPPVQTELLACFAASWWQTLVRLRLPASVPYLIPSLRLAAASAVVGAIVAEISTGLQGGIGRLIISYAQQATGDPRPGLRADPRRRGDGPRRRRRHLRLRLRAAPLPAPGGRVVSAEAHAAVALSGVAKRFGSGDGSTLAVTDVDLTVAAGEFISLIGPSGCGKSTLLRIVADLVEPSGGEVLVNGKTARRARLDQDYGIAFQQAGLLEWRTVLGNVELPLALHGTGKAERRRQAQELLELVGLAEFAGHRPSQLSGGMQQRVAIARALARRPALLLMDEPFGALDEMTRERMQTELLRICSETGAAVVFVTHSIPEAVYLSHRVVVMSARPGRITHVVDVALGTRDEDVRESDRFFGAITEVREALRGRGTAAREATS